jgi:hypothetical protein
MPIALLWAASAQAFWSVRTMVVGRVSALMQTPDNSGFIRTCVYAAGTVEKVIFICNGYLVCLVSDPLRRSSDDPRLRGKDPWKHGFFGDAGKHQGWLHHWFLMFVCAAAQQSDWSF